MKSDIETKLEMHEKMAAKYRSISLAVFEYHDQEAAKIRKQMGRSANPSPVSSPQGGEEQSTPNAS